MSNRTVDHICLAAALLVPPAVAALLVPLRDHVTNADTVLVMVLAVVAVAIPGRRTAAAVAGLGAGVWFDFFQTRPYYSFAISRRADLETTVLLLVVGLAVGELTLRGRRHRDDADTAAEDIALIHRVAGMVSDATDVDVVIRTVQRSLVERLDLRECWFETSFAERPGAFIERQGGVTWGAISWAPEHMGLPSKEVTLVVQGNGRPFGRFVLVPKPGVPVSIDRLTVAVALADQVGAALAAIASPT